MRPAESSAAPAPDFDAFYDERRPNALRLAHLITGSAVAAQDVVQDAFVAVHTSWASIANREAYLRSAVVNLSRSVQRKLIRERFSVRRIVDVPASTPEIDETWRVLRRLPVDQRTVVVLRFYEDMSLAEIAAALDKPIGTIKSTLHRALARLKEDLS